MKDEAIRISDCDISEMPYFLTNEDWFYYDKEEKIYRLTDKATKKARESYEEFYKGGVYEGNMITER